MHVSLASTVIWASNLTLVSACIAGKYYVYTQILAYMLYFVENTHNTYHMCNYKILNLAAMA